MNRGLCFKRKPHAAWGGDSDKPASFVVLCKLELPFWDICVARPCLIGTPELSIAGICLNFINICIYAKIVKTLQRPFWKMSRISSNLKKCSNDKRSKNHSGNFWNRMPFNAITMKEDERGHFFCGTMAPMAQHKMVKSRSFHVKPSKSNFVNILENYASTLVI